MKNTLYNSIKKILMDDDFIIDEKKSSEVLKEINLLSRSILELGIKKKDKLAIIRQNSLEYIELIYAFSRLGIGIDVFDSSIKIDSDYDYLFTDDTKNINCDKFKKIILFNSKEVKDDLFINWNDFCKIACYYNKSITNYNDFFIKYYDNGVLLILNDDDILLSVTNIKERLNIKSNSIKIDDASFVLINYLIMCKYNVYFKNFSSETLFTCDSKLVKSTYNLNYNTIYSRFEFLDEFELSLINDSFGSKYNRYFAFYNNLIALGKYGRLSLFNDEDISITHVLNGKNTSFGSIDVKCKKKFIKTNFVGRFSKQELKIDDFLEKEIIREERRKTGLPSQDMPWLKYYPKESSNEKISEYTLYQNLKILNENNYLECALEYMGEEIKYYEVFNEIEKVSKSLYALGVRKGDYVAFCLPNIPEFIYFFYAASKIGAIACLIEPRTSANRILKYLDDAKCKVMVMLDLCKKNIDLIADKCSLEKIVSISPIQSIKNKKIRRVYSLTHKKYKYSGKYLSYSKFLSIGESILPFKECKYKKNTAAAVVYTSGTTGNPKGAVLTNETFNGQNMQLKYSGIRINVGDRFLGNIPFFTAYGCSVGMHNALSFGVKITLIPSYKPKDFPYLVKKYKPNHVIGTPRFFEIMAESNIFKNEDLSYLKTCIYGGDKMTPTREYMVNEFLKSKGTFEIRKGIGMSEYGGGFCTTVNRDVNKIGSIGIPHVGNNVKIVDKDGNEVSYGREHKIGELYVSGPTQMLGYLENKEENDKFFIMDNNGVRWSKTGDLVYMDEDGVIFFSERVKNIIVRPDGHKVTVLPLENLVNTCEYVSECIVVGVNYTQDNTGKYPMIYIALKNNLDKSKEKVHKEIMELINNNIPNRDRPEWYRYVDKLPYTLAGKVDVMKLKEKGKKNQNKAVLYDIKKK